MAKTYTVQDSATGKNITFAWGGADPPTEEDMAHVVDQAESSLSRTDQIAKGAKMNQQEASDYMKNRAAFAREGGSSVFGKPTPTDTRKTSYTPPKIESFAKKVAPYARPVLEGGGAAVGGILGGTAGTFGAGPVGTAAGGVAGGSLGYAMGKNLADFIAGDHAASPEDAAKRTANDLMSGAMYEMGGQAAGKVLGEAAKAVTKYATKSPIQDIAARKAQQTLSSIADLTPQESANLAQGEQLVNRLNSTPPQAGWGKPTIPTTGTKVALTPAQMTGNPGTAAMEQALSTADPRFAATLNAQDTAAKQVALDRIRQSVGKGGSLPTPRDPATIGQNVVGKINDYLAPVKQRERELWGEVPNYPIPTANFDAAARAIKSTPLESDTELAVNKILDFAERMPKTTQGLQSIERTIGDKMTSGDANIRRVLGDLKAAVGADFKAMGEAADAGSVAVHEGKVVYPARLEAEKNNLIKQIAEEQSAAEVTPDIDAIRNALKENGLPPNIWMRQVNETPQQYNSRLITQYKKTIGVETPMLSAEAPPTIARHNERIAEIDNILANAQPAEDVASKYKTAKDFSRTQKFDRFGKGAVDRVLQRGNELGGLRTVDENIARQFYTPSGAKGLIHAIGKTAAKEQMKPYMIADMLKSAAPDGVTYNLQSGLNYIQKNRAVLERFGLVDDARQVLKDQIPTELERMLAKRAPDSVTGAQFFTAQDMRTILQKYGNTIKQLYGHETLQAFRDYNQLMGMIDRKNVVPRGGNSNTSEKAMNMANLMIKGSIGPERKLSEGLLGAIAKGAGIGTGAGLAGGHMSWQTAGGGAAIMAGTQIYKNAESQVAKTFVKILQDATLNPALAKDLMTVARKGTVPDTLQAVIDSHLLTATSAATIEPDPLGLRATEEEEP